MGEEHIGQGNGKDKILLNDETYLKTDKIMKRNRKLILNMPT